MSLVCSLRAYLSDDPAISLTHAQEALEAAMAMPADQEAEGRDLAIRACRRVRVEARQSRDRPSD